MAGNSVFKEAEITWIEDDVEKIRTKTEMYVSYRGSRAALHMAKEVVNNHIDEVTDPDSPGTTVEIFCDEARNMVTSSDDGRGIPLEKVETISTKLQSGSKFDKSGAASAGENGVGLTAVNALSNTLKYIIHRQTSETTSDKGTFEFHEGKLVSKKISGIKGAKHGTTMVYVPSEEVLGSCQIDCDDLTKWVDKISYIVGKDTTLKLSVLRKGKDVESNMKFRHKRGFVEYLDVMSKEQLVAPVMVQSEMTSEGINKVQVAFTFNPSANEENIDSFMNYVNTIDGGVHVNAARFAICSCLSKLANEKLTDAEKKKFEITNDDCKTGLVMAVNVFCRHAGFTGQTKEKCGNDDLFKPIRGMVYTEVMKFFKKNSKELDRIVSYLKKVAKSRLEITRIRKADMAGFSSFDSSVMKNFSDKTGHGYGELYIAEGLSAKGSINAARDPRFQAVYALRGLTLNTILASLAKIKNNPEIWTLVRIMGTGIGKYFDLTKSNYQKYIITTDADIDGSNITSSTSAFMFFHARPIVEAGMLYKALPPLYKVKDGKDYKYAVSNSEFAEMCIDTYVRETGVSLDGTRMSKSELKKFYTDNERYLDTLKSIYSYFYTHPDIVEFCVRYKDQSNFTSLLKKRFPELKLEDGCIKGSYAGAFQFVPLDNVFDTKTYQLKDLIFNDTNKGNLFYDYQDANGVLKSVTIGNVLAKAETHKPAKEARWKGLGAIQAETFWETVLNPEKRKLIQLTTDDIEADMQKMRVLHGDDPSLRRALLDNYKLNINDIDN